MPQAKPIHALHHGRAAHSAQEHAHSHAGADAHPGSKPKLYNPRHPEHTLLYHTGAEHFETWLELASAGQFDGQGDHHTPRSYVRQGFRKYLECGIFAHGFARARSDEGVSTPHGRRFFSCCNDGQPRRQHQFSGKQGHAAQGLGADR